MSRMVRDKKLDTKEARRKLTARGRPYYRGIGPQLHLGYRKLSGDAAGSWSLRNYAEGKYTNKKIGIADDLTNADGETVFDYWQAQDAARKAAAAFVKSSTGKTGPYTVDQAADDYQAFLEDGGRDKAAIRDATTRIDAFIRPTLGSFEVAALEATQLRRWLAKLANAAPRLRTAPDKKQKYREVSDDEDAVRQRKATANRILTTLKAMLNRAYIDEMVTSNKAWGRRVVPFEGTDAARQRYLEIEEVKRLVNACDADFRMLVQAALQTGARVGQIKNMKVKDFIPDTGTIDFRSKKGRGKEKSFSCLLSDEGILFFKQVCLGRARGDLMFTKADGTAWGDKDHVRPMKEACKGAKIKPAIGIHQLRHTWATHALNNGTPRIVVAKNLGHSDTRMVDKHYGHIKETYIKEALRAGAPKFGFKPDPKVVSLAGRG